MTIPIWLYGDKLAVAKVLKERGFNYEGEVKEEIPHFFEECEFGDYDHFDSVEGYMIGDILEDVSLQVIFPSGEMFVKEIPYLWDDDKDIPIGENGEIINLEPLIKETIALIKDTLYEWHHQGQLSLFTA